MVLKNRQKTYAGLLLLIAVIMPLSGCAGKVDANSLPTGTIENKEVDVNSKIPGRVVEILVEEGSKVKPGQVVARLDTSDLEAKEKELIAQINAAKAQLDQSKTTVRLQDGLSAASVKQAEATLKKARSESDILEKTRARLEKLYQENAIPEQQYDEARAKADAARAAVGQAEAALMTAQANRIQVEAGNDAVSMAAAKYEQAKAALEELRVNLAESVIKSPTEGTVSEIIVEKGELVSVGMPLMTVSDFNDNWVNVKVSQEIVQDLKIKQKAALALGQHKYTGEIIEISRKPNFATHRSTNDRGEKDIITYNVKIKVNDPHLLPGMELSVNFK